MLLESAKSTEADWIDRPDRDEGDGMMTFQKIIESIETLPVEDQDYLFDLIRRRRISQRRTEILAKAQEAMQAVKDGTAKRGSVQDLIADLLENDDVSCLE